jgi:hypothetical protein
MISRFARLLLLAGCVSFLLAGSGPVRGQRPHEPPFGQGTFLFRNLLHYNLKLTPVKDPHDLGDPSRTILIVLGETEVLGGLPFKLKDFLEQGGAALVATDRKTLPKDTPEGTNAAGNQLDRELGVGVTGDAAVQVDNVPRYTYRGGLAECPLVQPDPDAVPALFPTIPRLAVATNKPSYLNMKLKRMEAHGLSLIASLPPGCRPSEFADWDLRGVPWPPLPFAAAGKVGRKGRLVVLADHSIFIDSMLYPKDTANAAFAESCVAWLTEGGRQPCDRVLFYEEGILRTRFDVLPVRNEPINLPPPEKLVPLLDRFLADAERTDTFDSILRDLVPLQVWLTVGLVVLTLGLGFYGFCRLSAARHRPEGGALLLATALTQNAAAGATTEQRHRAMLAGGNLWEASRPLCRACFAGQPGGDRPEVAVSAGNWWQRRALRRRVLRLWELAHGKPVRVSAAEFARLPGQIEEVKAALAAGTIHIRTPNQLASGAASARR